MASKKTLRASVRPNASGTQKVIPSRSPRTQLTWAEERFVEAYVNNGGNATQAYRRSHPSCSPAAARVNGQKYTSKPHMREAIEQKKEEVRQHLNISREELLLVYIGMAMAKQSDFAKVLKNPADRDSYKGLGIHEYAIKSAKKSYTQGNEVTLVDRKAALDELWTKLGFDKATRKGNWFDGFDQVAKLIQGLEKDK